jgi:hypothetical protein
MATAAEVRSVSRRFEWRNHRHVARLSLQLDGGLPFDETRGCRSSAVHRHGRIFNQTAAADSDEGSNFTFSARCRSNRRPRDSRRNIERRRKSLRDLSGNFRRGERRPSSISSLVAIRPTQSAPGVTRTPDLRIRNPLLYPAELRAHLLGKMAVYLAGLPSRGQEIDGKLQSNSR